jgi:ArsR family transcriptional regulator, arsenate/arsenite/antimonite-responsive transcriptional repressor
MKQRDSQEFEGVASYFKALAHPSRVFIAKKLVERAYCVYELTEMVGVDTSTISKHLAVLKQAGIVTDRKEGTQVYYALKNSSLETVFSATERAILANEKAPKAVAIPEKGGPRASKPKAKARAKKAPAKAGKGAKGKAKK